MLLPDDERHGTTRGHAQGCRCDPCKAARNADECRRRKQRQALGIKRSIDATGTRRRIHALMALGHSSGTIGAHFGVTSQAVLQVAERRWVQRHTAAAIARAYDELQHVPGASPRTRGAAARRGWPTPNRWLDIDDPAEQPDPGYADTARDPNDLDPVVIDRILAGDMSLAPTATHAERVQIVAAWPGGANDLERRTGWRPTRYRQKAIA